MPIIKYLPPDIVTIENFKYYLDEKGQVNVEI